MWVCRRKSHSCTAEQPCSAVCGPVVKSGWHPNPGTDAEAMIEILRDELDACKDEIKRLRAQNKLLLALGEDRDVQTFGCGVYRVVPT